MNDFTFPKMSTFPRETTGDFVQDNAPGSGNEELRTSRDMTNHALDVKKGCSFSQGVKKNNYVTDKPSKRFCSQVSI